MSHKLELETNEVNYILELLANQPYGKVVQLVNKIQQQAEPKIVPEKLAEVPAIKEEKSERKGNKGTTKKK